MVLTTEGRFSGGASFGFFTTEITEITEYILDDYTFWTGLTLKPFEGVLYNGFVYHEDHGDHIGYYSSQVHEEKYEPKTSCTSW